MFTSFINYHQYHQPSPRTTERFKPYTTSTARNRRLESILYKSAKKSPDLQDGLKPAHQPPLYNFMSCQEKLDRLRKLIGNITNESESHQTSTTSFSPQNYYDYVGSSLASRTVEDSPLMVTPMLPSRSRLYPPRPSQWQPNYLKNTISNSIPNMSKLFADDAAISADHQHRPSAVVPRTTSSSTHLPVAAQPHQLSTPAISAPLLVLPTPIAALLPPPPHVPLPSPQQALPSMKTRWRDQKHRDEKQQRDVIIKQLQEEIRDRETARHVRKMEDEEDRRFRLRLEGLRLERRAAPREEFPELPSQAGPIIKYIWDRRASPTEVIVKGPENITRKDLMTLSGSEWLNDEVINFFLNLVVERNRKDSNLPKVYTFNTFFYQKLCQDGFAGVKRWTRKADLFSHQLLLVPIHLGNHWCMAIVDFDQRRIDYYDSLLGNNVECLEALSRYLEEESTDKKKQPFDTSDWELMCRKDIPHQMNMCDCGMFACIFAEYASRRAKITFSQRNIPYFRQRMVWEIYQGKLLG